MDGDASQQPDDGRAERRAQVLLDLRAAQSRRRHGGVTLRLPRSLPVPTTDRPRRGGASTG